jgi:hypothetical protein
MRSRRRFALVGFAGLAAAVMIGSYAWACSPFAGSHSGLLWICQATQTVTCNYNTITNNTNPTHNLSFYSQGSGHTNNGSYNMKYVAGDHSAPTDISCDNGTTFTGGANIVASSTGTWSGKGPLTIPNVTGVHTVCSTPLPGNDSRNFITSGLTLWAFM